MPTSPAHETLRFGDFELDVEAYQLRRQGRPVKLERRPMELLILLVEHRGRLVSRSQIAERLWGKDVFVDVETGVNIAISKVRHALRDSTEKPECLETVVGKGYRFVAAVEVVSRGGAIPIAESRGDRPLDASVISGDAVPFGARTLPSRGSRLAVGLFGCALIVAFAVWVWVTARPTRPVKLAVLPFANLTGNQDREYLADGLTEEATVTLAQIAPQQLSVVGRQSVMAYKRSSKSLVAIGNELGVNYLLESSIRAEGDRLRITSKLIRVRDQLQLWSQSYNRDAGSVLGLQQELSTAIGEQIRLRLSPEGIAAIARRQSERPEAFDLYLRGRYYANQRTPATVARALEYYQRATEIDPNYALAWSGIADALTSRPINSDFPASAVRRDAREAAERAVRADPNLAEAQTALGRVDFWLEWDWPAAEVAFRRAIVLNESYAQAHLMLGHVLSQMGRHNDAVAELRRVRELDPLNAMSHAISALVAFQARNYSAALEHAERATVVGPEFWIGHAQRAQAYEQLGRRDAALDAIVRAGALSGGSHMAIAVRGHVLATMGREREAREVLRALEQGSREGYVPSTGPALVYAGLGERARMFEWLEKAYAVQDVNLVFLSVDPRWDVYRDDPRFVALLARCGFRRNTTRDLSIDERLFPPVSSNAAGFIRPRRRRSQTLGPQHVPRRCRPT
jgi:TolB-like protein/DNA-binding winged helix-turn-helix (wHTH) protein/Flp pilus assembly protein TadD